MSIDPLDDPDLPALLSTALELRDQGLDTPLEEICRKRPDLVDALALSLKTSEQVPALQRAASAADRWIGRVLDERYELEARLGAGAMGVVYRALDIELQRHVAIKILRAALIDGEEAEERFAREAEALAAIDHPATVTIYDRGATDDEDPYLVMELLEGLTLAQLLEEGDWSGDGHSSRGTQWIAHILGVDALAEPSYLRAATSWAADLAAGLEASHAKGIFHRDVKPSNVFLRRDGRPVLLDFGIATRVSNATLTREGMPIGTPAYMAPESLLEESGTTPARDVYGLAATLYHLLTLHPPYRGTPSQVLTSLAARDPRPAHRLRPGLPRDIGAILDRGLARRPKDRYPSAGALEADLRAFLEHRPVQARPLYPWVRSWRRARRSPAFLTGAAVALLLLSILGAVKVRETWVAARAVALLDVWEKLPPNLSLVDPQNRTIGGAAERAAVEDLLDEAAELCAAPLPTYLVRACFRLDHGRPAEAAQDMAIIAGSIESPYALELARRYANMPPDASAAADVDLSELPEPTLPMDAYLAAFHAIRGGDMASAGPLLDDPGLAEFVPALEITTLLLGGDAHRMYETAVRVEELVGRRTAMTSYLTGTALFRLHRFSEAYELFAEGIAFAPTSHVRRSWSVLVWRKPAVRPRPYFFRTPNAARTGRYRSISTASLCRLGWGSLTQKPTTTQSGCTTPTSSIRTSRSWTVATPRSPKFRTSTLRCPRRCCSCCSIRRL